GLGWDAARVLLVLGRAQRRASKRAAARDSLEQARAGVEQLGCPGWAAAAAAELDRISGRRAAAAGGLTPREPRGPPRGAASAPRPACSTSSPPTSCRCPPPPSTRICAPYTPSSASPPAPSSPGPWAPPARPARRAGPGRSAAKDHVFTGVIAARARLR